MYGPEWAILLMYGSHDMRHTGFGRLTVVNGPPKIGASQVGCYSYGYCSRVNLPCLIP